VAVHSILVAAEEEQRIQAAVDMAAVDMAAVDMAAVDMAAAGFPLQVGVVDTGHYEVNCQPVAGFATEGSLEPDRVIDCSWFHFPFFSFQDFFSVDVNASTLT
jgi:hypothetical protein